LIKDFLVIFELFTNPLENHPKAEASLSFGQKKNWKRPIFSVFQFPNIPLRGFLVPHVTQLFYIYHKEKLLVNKNLIL